jgi:hypothetical protein
MKNTLSTHRNLHTGYIFKTLASVAILSASFSSHADVFSMIESKPLSEVWLNPGFYSYHFQKNAGFKNNNFGIGAEYRYSTVNSVTVGTFTNSDYKNSRFLGWYWQPVAVGPVRLGAVAGVLDGYPKMRNGGWFAAAIPTASYENQRVGANVLIVPSYQNRLHGAISLQLKVKVN